MRIEAQGEIQVGIRRTEYVYLTREFFKTIFLAPTEVLKCVSRQTFVI